MTQEKLRPEMLVENFIPHLVSLDQAYVDGGSCLRLMKNPEVFEADQPTYAFLKDFEMENGAMEVEVKGLLLPDAPDHARGFIGFAFRIAQDHSQFESFYIRPTNGRAPVQLRRNRATQYFAFPDFSYEVSRATAPGEYESYVDLELGEWTHLRVEIQGDQGRFYVHQADQPTLIVNDLKRAGQKGGIGLWVDVGTEGYFRNLSVESWD